MNKLSKEKRDKLLLVGIGTACVLAAVYMLVINAQQSALQDYAERTDAAMEKLAKAERWLRMAPTVDSRLQSARAELEAKQEKNMAPVDKFKWFYNTLDQFLAQRRVKLVDITREPELAEVGVLPKFPYQSASFGVKLTARYHDFGAFLADFENSFPYFRVQNLEIEPAGSSKAISKDLVRGGPERPPEPESLAITMRVVTLIKPTASL